MKKVFFVAMVLSSFLYSAIYEDAEDGSISRWVVPTGATVSNVVDSDTNSKVIHLSANTLKYYSLANVASNSDKAISWDVKADHGFTAYVVVSTSLGERTLYYSTTTINRSKSGNFIHHPLGDLTRNSWHTITRDLEADLQDFEPSNHVTMIKLFKIRTLGTASLDNLEACDGNGGEVSNNPPVANAGADQTIATSSTQVQLDGSASNDADGDPLTYQWTITTKPSGSSATLSDATLVNPTFVADMDGIYTLQLIVNDGQVDSVADTVVITTSGLIGEYYGINHQLNRISDVTDAILASGNNPDATFIATIIDYGNGHGGYGTGTLSQGTNLQTFLGGDATSLDRDPGNTTDGAVHFTGSVYFEAGTYNFKITADDGYQIKIDGVSVAEVDYNQAPTTRVHAEFTIDTAGYYPTEMIYWDQGGLYQFKVEISSDGGITYNVLDASRTMP